MMRALKGLTFGAVLACALSFSQFAQAAFLFYGSKRVTFADTSIDCLDVAIRNLNTEAFSNIKRNPSDVSGTRQNAFVVITCFANPAAPNFVFVVMVVGDDEQTAIFLRDRMLSLL